MAELDENGLGWVLEPLLGAGLSVDQVRDLLFRLAFEAVVSELPGAGVRATDAVAGQPDAVRAAWAKMLLRLMLLEPLHEDGADDGLATAEG
ncbi:hypothetical protein [Modestobacter sp. SYSU DS0875]